jgi:hypothetical protein
MAGLSPSSPDFDETTFPTTILTNGKYREEELSIANSPRVKSKA